MSMFLGEKYKKGDFVNFRFFITPQITKALWAAFSILSTIGIVVWAFAMCDDLSSGLFLSMILVPLALLLVRLFFETFMVFFAMISLLSEIRDNLSKDYCDEE